jgi:hypothetical protein
VNAKSEEIWDHDDPLDTARCQRRHSTPQVGLAQFEKSWLHVQKWTGVRQSRRETAYPVVSRFNTRPVGEDDDAARHSTFITPPGRAALKRRLCLAGEWLCRVNV